MANQSGSDLSPTASSFALHLSAFHATLPAEERQLLEQLVALAEAASSGDEVKGYAAVDFFLKIEGASAKSNWIKGGADLKSTFIATPFDQFAYKVAHKLQ